MYCGPKVERLSYENISTIMFLSPEVAAIGMNESQAQEQRIPYRVAVYGYELVNRAIAMRAIDGFVKILTTDDDEMRILGMRALGVHASTTIEASASCSATVARPGSSLSCCTRTPRSPRASRTASGCSWARRSTSRASSSRRCVSLASGTATA
jgi:hypothetical protein